MSDLYRDLKYLGFISHRIEQFTKVDTQKYACRCPICGDSKKNKTKKRGNFYPFDGGMFYHCYNCGASMSFWQFLKDFDGNLYGDYRLEKYRDENPVKETEITIPKNTTAQRLDRSSIDKLLIPLSDLDDDNPAVQYAISRKIPTEKFTNLFYCDNIKKLEVLSPEFKDKIPTKDDRLVLPFIDEVGKIIGFTARALGSQQLRYVTMKADPNATMVFGKLNPNKHGYIVEGPIDSLFLDNCIAVAGTSFGKIDKMDINKNNVTLILDNQPRNKEVLKVYEKFIKLGWKLVIWPNVQGKDINDMIKSGMDKAQLLSLINKNTFSGLDATLQFNRWKKI